MLQIRQEYKTQYNLTLYAGGQTIVVAPSEWLLLVANKESESVITRSEQSYVLIKAWMALVYLHQLRLSFQLMMTEMSLMSWWQSLQIDNEW